MSPKKAVVLGIDVGGTNTAFGLVDEDGNVVEEQTMKTESQKGADALLSRIAQQVRRIMKETSRNFELKAIGLGAPNANYYRSTIERAPNLKWEYVNMAEISAKYFDVPMFITNDANASAIGELYFGAARGMRDVIVITLGTGLGSGIIINGELVYGADGFAGELGHTTVEPGGRECNCGNYGCLETYASATGIKRTVCELLGKRNSKSVFRKMSYKSVDSRRIAQAAAEGDPIAKEAFEYTAYLLGISLANFVLFSRPEAIILFGGLAAAGDLLFEPTRKSMEEHLLGLFKGKIKLLPSGLANGNSAVLGAAALAWHELTNRTSAPA